MEFMEPAGNTPLAHLEKYFFGAAAPTREGGGDQVRLYEATSAYAEVEYVSAQIRQMLRGGYRCRDIAVTARDLTGSPCAGAYFRQGRNPGVYEPPQ